MRCHSGTSLFMFLVFLCLIFPGELSVAADTPNGVPEEAVRGWLRIEQSLSPPISGSWMETFESAVADPKNPGAVKRSVTKRENKFWITEDAKKTVQELYDTSRKWYGRRVVGVNPDYAFIAGQKVQDGPYVLRESHRDQPGIDHLASTMVELGCVQLPIESPVSGETLIQTVKRDDFKLISSRELTEAGHKYFEIKFEVMVKVPAKNQDNPPEKLTSTVVLDPAANWHVVKSSSSRKDLDWNMEVHYAPDGTVSDWVTHRRTPQGTYTGTNTFTLEHQPTALSEFSLTALQLPEPPGGGLSWNWLLLLIAFALAVLVAIFTVIMRRKQAATF